MFETNNYLPNSTLSTGKVLVIKPEVKQLLKAQALLFAFGAGMAFSLSKYASEYIVISFLLVSVLASATGIIIYLLPVEKIYSWVTGGVLAGGLFAGSMVAGAVQWGWVTAALYFYLPTALLLLFNGIKEWPKPFIPLLSGLHDATSTRESMALANAESLYGVRFNSLFPAGEKITIAYPIHREVIKEEPWTLLLSIFLLYAHNRGQGISTHQLQRFNSDTFSMWCRDKLGRRRYLGANDRPIDVNPGTFPLIRIRNWNDIDFYLIRTIDVYFTNGDNLNN